MRMLRGVGASRIFAALKEERGGLAFGGARRVLFPLCLIAGILSEPSAH